MGDRAEEISIVELLGWSEGGKCGYCKDTKGDHLKSSLGEKKEDEVVNGSSVSLGLSCLFIQITIYLFTSGCVAYSLSVRDFENFLLWGWSR